MNNNQKAKQPIREIELEVPKYDAQDKKEGLVDNKAPPSNTRENAAGFP